MIISFIEEYECYSLSNLSENISVIKLKDFSSDFKEDQSNSFVSLYIINQEFSF